MENNLLNKLEELSTRIQTEDIAKEASAIKEWGGADVIISNQLDKNTERWLGDQPLIISFQTREPRRRVVITEYSKELSWLFYELKQIFTEKIDYILKYDFYGSLAQSALDYLEKNKDSKDLKTFLLTVLNSSKEFSKLP
jgi:hypothetical protein